MRKLLRDMEKERDGADEIRTATAVQLNEALARIAVLSRLAACLASAVKCGEPWTDTLEREYLIALAVPPEVCAACSGSEVRLHVASGLLLCPKCWP